MAPAAPPSGTMLQKFNEAQMEAENLIHVCFIFFFPHNVPAHKGESFCRLDDAYVLMLLSAMDFLSLPVQRQADAITSLITVRQSNYHADSRKIL